MDVFDAPWPVEKVGSIPIFDYPRQRQAPVRVRVADVFIPDCRAGDRLIVACGIQVTNDQQYPVECGLSLVWTPDRDGIAGDIVSVERGGNVTQQVQGQGGMHHFAFERQAQFTVPRDGDGWLIAVMIVGGGSNTNVGDTLIIDQGLGELKATRFSC